MIYRDPIDVVIRENFDLSDDNTRKFIVSLNENEKATVVTALASALYDKIVENVDEIDFGSIPKSKGDITKIDGYENTIECLDIIKNLINEYKESTDAVDIVINAINNIKQRKSIFMKAFALNVELPMINYNLITLAIEHSVSFLISVCIDYVKNPNSTISMSISNSAYKYAQDNMLFKQLQEFNKACGTGQIDSVFTEIINKKPVREAMEPQDILSDDEITAPEDQNTVPVKVDICPVCKQVKCICTKQDIFKGQIDDNEPANIQPIIPEDSDPNIDPSEDDYDSTPVYDEPLDEVGVSALVLGKIAIGVGGALFALKGATYLVKFLIPKMRSITYFLVSTKVKISESLALQAQLIELNANKLAYDNESNLSEEKKKKIVAKQLKIANNLKKWSNKFAIDSKTAEKKAKELEKNDDKKYKKEDVEKDVPEDEGDILF